MKKCETLENDASAQEAELTKARQSAETARNEAQAALQEIQEAKKIVAGKAFSMQSKYVKKYFLLTQIRSSPGLLLICHEVCLTPRSSSEPKKGAPRRSCSGRNILRQNIRCPSAIS